MVILPPDFYRQPTLAVAPALLGCFLVHNTPAGKQVGRIIETEAYLGLGDAASHSSRGLTPRTAPLFGQAGIIYVYLIYGMYHCLNVVTDTPESGGAVLIRAVSPIQNLSGKTSGPGLLCKAYGITRAYTGQPITEGPLTIQRDPAQVTPPSITTSPRVGIDYAGEDRDRPYRFRIADSL